MVYGAACHVEKPTDHRVAHRHRDRRAGVGDLRPAGQSRHLLGRDAADRVAVEIVLHLERQAARLGPQDVERRVDRRSIPSKRTMITEPETCETVPRSRSLTS